jgi:hypothetical protein
MFFHRPLRAIDRRAPCPFAMLGLVASYLMAAAGCGREAQGDNRTYWKHSNGYFAKTADGWTEQAPDGVHTFRETGRTANYVELNDPQRGITVLLHDNHVETKVPGAPGNPRLYEGGWTKVPTGSAAN